MKEDIQTTRQMVEGSGASEIEAKQALAVFEVLRPGLKIKANGRIEMVGGDKTPLGMFRTIMRTINEAK